MKQLAIALLFILAVACSSEQTSTNTQETESTLVADFISDISSLEEIEKGNPIVMFQEQAEGQADKTMSLSKDNISEVLETAKSYSSLVIVVEDHTIVKIDDVEDCKASGSWGACMPMAKGYIKKKDLVSQKDYINNIIGRPDAQKRVVYFFE
jgi:ABC-type phosphate/phosphonate transport system substrate-binding protein